MSVQLRGVHKFYRSGTTAVHALSHIDVTVKKGEFVSIMGPSGSGKSTLLQLIGLLDVPSKGTIRIDSTDVSKLSDEKRTAFRLRTLGFVFQFYSLLPELTALENVQVPQLLRGKHGDAAREEAETVLGRFGLAGRVRNYPPQLSGGEQQRVSIARAIVNRPMLLLADEPTASLDSKSALNVIKTFRELNDEGQTVLMVTHEEHLGKMAERGIWLKDGKIEKEKAF